MAITVSGLTMMRAERQPDHSCESQTHKQHAMKNKPVFLLGSLKHEELVPKRD
jgi:hypothetical protein